MGSLSKFLPDGFDAGAAVAILAGKGRYPFVLRQKLRDAGVRHVLMAFEDETSPELWASFPESERYCAMSASSGGSSKTCVQAAQNTR